MKKIIVLVFILIVFLNVFSYYSLIDSLSQELSIDSIYDMLYILSGEQPYASGYYSWNRYCLLEGVDTAAHYLEGKLSAYGLDSVFLQYYTDTIKDDFVPFFGDSIYTAANVVGLKRGNSTSDTCIIIGGHFDNVSEPLLDINTKSPGVDDNASGTAAVIEIARAFENLECDYDIYFVCFNGEEVGLHGATKFLTNYIEPNNLYVYGMLNLDMIAFVEYDYLTRLYGNPSGLLSIASNMMDNITTNSNYVGHICVADDIVYDAAGYRTCCFIEANWSASPGYHNVIDSVSFLVQDYYYENVKGIFGTLFYISNMPTEVTLTGIIDNGDSSVTITWNPLIINDLSHYKFYYRTGYQEVDTLSVSSDSTQYTFKHLLADSIFTVSLAAVDTIGLESYRDNELSVPITYIPHAPDIVEIASDAQYIYLNFNENVAADFNHYNIYRKAQDETVFNFISATFDSFYIDSNVVDKMYSYTITAVDNDSLESGFSKIVRSRIISLSDYLLVIDETNNNVLFTDNACDAFYDSVFIDYFHSNVDCDTSEYVNSAYWGNYEYTIYIDDDNTEFRMDTNNMKSYIDNGGKILIIGWNEGKYICGNLADNPAYPDTTSFAYNYAGISSYRYNQLFDMDCIIMDTDSFFFSADKLPRGSAGNLNYGGVFELSNGYSLGYYNSISDDSLFDGKPVVIVNQDTSLILVNAPLFSMEREDAIALMDRLLSLWGVLSFADNPVNNNKLVDIRSIYFSKPIFRIEGFKDQKVKVSVYDINGRNVYERNIKSNSNIEYINIDLKTNSGIYFVKVQSGGFSRTDKIVLMQ